MLVVVVGVGSAGCGGGSSEPPGETVGASAACAPALVYDGDLYLGYRAGPAFVQGAPLGTGTLPPCNDHGADADPEPAEEIDVAAVDGIQPSVAVAWRGRDDDLVYVREDVDPASLPPGLVDS